MSLLVNQTQINTNNSFFALAGSGGGGGVTPSLVVGDISGNYNLSDIASGTNQFIHAYGVSEYCPLGEHWYEVHIPVTLSSIQIEDIVENGANINLYLEYGSTIQGTNVFITNSNISTANKQSAYLIMRFKTDTDPTNLDIALNLYNGTGYNIGTITVDVPYVSVYDIGGNVTELS